MLHAAPVEPEMDPRDRYQTYLTSKNTDPTNAAEDTAFAMGTFRYFYLPTPRGKTLEAAVSPQTLITGTGTGDWVAFLESGPSPDLGKRIAWLLGNPSALGPESPVVKQLPAEVSARIQAPVVTFDKTAEQASFVGYFLFQPGSQVLKLTLVATHTGATLSWDEP